MQQGVGAALRDRECGCRHDWLPALRSLRLFRNSSSHVLHGRSDWLRFAQGPLHATSAIASTLGGPGVVPGPCARPAPSCQNGERTIERPGYRSNQEIALGGPFSTGRTEKVAGAVEHGGRAGGGYALCWLPSAPETAPYSYTTVLYYARARVVTSCRSLRGTPPDMQTGDPDCRCPNRLRLCSRAVRQTSARLPESREWGIERAEDSPWEEPIPCHSLGLRVDPGLPKPLSADLALPFRRRAEA